MYIPFIVSDMLHFSNVDLSGFLIKSFIIPVRVKVTEFLGQSVVLSNPDSVEGCETWLFISSGVTFWGEKCN